MDKKYSIINYGAGNILSVLRAFKKISKFVNIISTPEEVKNASYLILPGDGSFKYAAKIMEKKGIKEKILEHVRRGNPLIGICLGMQYLLSKSEEFGVTEGLSVIEGEVKKIKTNDIMLNKVPVIGWNKTYFNKNSDKKFKMLNNFVFEKEFYYVHSYSVFLKNKNEIIAYYLYDNQKISSIIGKDNVVGFQFHPEKSRKEGINLLKQISRLKL